MTQSKDTIYIEADEDIAAVIDKLVGSSQKIVALVIPKRAAAFQSLINLKLLKRAAIGAGKQAVLITADASLLPLAAAASLFVAPNLTTPPSVPAIQEEQSDSRQEEVTLPVTPGAEPNPEGAISNASQLEPAGITGAGRRNKKIRVPDFEKFRIKLFIALAALLLLASIVWAVARVLPRANINITGDTQAVAAKLELLASPKLSAVDTASLRVPAKVASVRKSDVIKTAATGQKDKGTKATGSITVINCQESSPVTLPAGTKFTTGTLVFTSDQLATVPGSTYKKVGGEFQCQQDGQASVKVTAVSAGDSYNTGPRSYSVSIAGDIRAQGGQMSGGTSQVVKTVSAADVDGARQKVTEQNKSAAQSELAALLTREGFLPVTQTLSIGDPVITNTPAVGDEASEVSVSVALDYSMLGAERRGTRQLLVESVKEKIDMVKQQITDDGLDRPSWQLLERQPNGDARLALETTLTAGLQPDAAAIKKAVAGQRRRLAETALRQRPGVKDVSIQLSPFWVTVVPRDPSKIVVTFSGSK